MGWLANTSQPIFSGAEMPKIETTMKQPERERAVILYHAPWVLVMDKLFPTREAATHIRPKKVTDGITEN